MHIIKMNDLNLMNKKVFIRSDLNVPIKNGKIISDMRLRASLPTIKAALKQGAYVMVASHLGRPIEGKYDPIFSLQPIVNYFKKKISTPVRLVKDYLHGVKINKGELAILENVRFNIGETNNDEILSKQYAALCDIFVMDAFGTAHRAHSSTQGIGYFSPISCAGPLFLNEIKMLKKIFSNPEKPMVAIIGGSKISTKLTILKYLSKITDSIIVGGGIANTFIAAKGNNVGKSLYEVDLISETKNLLNSNILIPTEVKVAKNFSQSAIAILKSVDNIQNNEQILDLGSNFINELVKIINEARTILWNGPVGVFEFPNFRQGTEVIARAIANSNAFSVAGGGETLAAIDLFGIADKISYISTGGGAFLEFIQGKTLPVILMLEQRKSVN